MAEQETPALRKVAWTELLPWLNLARCFRIAIQIRLLFCGAVGAFVMLAGWWILGGFFSGNEAINRIQPPDPWTTLTHAIPNQPGILQWAKTPSAPTRSMMPPFGGIERHASAPFSVALESGGSKGFGDRLTRFTFALCCGLWALAVWGLLGGMITRAAAVELATLDRAKTGRTIRFAFGKWRAYFAAPFFPLVGVLLIGIPIAVAGLFLRTGPTLWLSAILWPLVLVAGFLMALLLLGLVFGWPLMWANISVEGVDSFDAVGRAYNYVFQRPLQYLFYLLVAAFLGALGWLLVWNFVAAIAGLSYGAAAWGAGGDRINWIIDCNTDKLGPVGGAGAYLLCFWVGCLKILGVGFLASYFWTASTAIYFLLRRDADATEMDEVCPEEEEQPAEAPPPARTEAPGAPAAENKLPNNQAE